VVWNKLQVRVTYVPFALCDIVEGVQILLTLSLVGITMESGCSGVMVLLNLCIYMNYMWVSGVGEGRSVVASANRAPCQD